MVMNLGSTMKDFTMFQEIGISDHFIEFPHLQNASNHYDCVDLT
jgi:hypothetical protein